MDKSDAVEVDLLVGNFGVLLLDLQVDSGWEVAQLYLFEVHLWASYVCEESSFEILNYFLAYYSHYIQAYKERLILASYIITLSL